MNRIFLIKKIISEVKPMQKLCVKQGHIWEKASLHLKSAITKFDHGNVVKLVELDLLKTAL